MKTSSGFSKKGSSVKTNTDRNIRQNSHGNFLNTGLYQRTLDTFQNSIEPDNSYSRLAQNRKVQKEGKVPMFEFEHSIQTDYYPKKSQSKSPNNRLTTINGMEASHFYENKQFLNNARGMDIIKLLQRDLDQHSEADSQIWSQFPGRIQMQNRGNRTPEPKRNSISPPKVKISNEKTPQIKNRYPSANNVQEYQREDVKNLAGLNPKIAKPQIGNLLIPNHQNSPSSREGYITEATTTASSRAGTKHLIREQENFANQPLFTSPDIIQKRMERLERKTSIQGSPNPVTKAVGEHASPQKRASQQANLQNLNTSASGLDNFKIQNKRQSLLRHSSIDNDIFQIPPSNSRGSFSGVPEFGRSTEQFRLQPNGISADVYLEEVRSFRPRIGSADSELENQEAPEKSAHDPDSLITETNTSLQNDTTKNKSEKLRELSIENRRLNEELAIEKNLREQQYVRLATEIELYKQKNPDVQIQSKRSSLGDAEELRSLKNKTTVTNEKLKSRINELEKSLETEKAQNQKYQEQISEMNSQFATQAQQMIEGLLKESTQREISLRSELARREDEIGQLKRYNLDLSRMNSGLEEEYQAQKIEITRLREQIREVYSQTDKIKMKIESLKKQLLEAIKQKNAISTDYEQQRADLERVRIRNKELLAEIDTLEAERKTILQQLKELKAKDLGAKFANYKTINKGFFRIKNLSEVYSGFKQITALFDDLAARLNREFLSQAGSIKDRLREELSQFELEIQFMLDNMALDDADPNSSAWQGLGEVPLTRDKSFTLGKSRVSKVSKPEKSKPETDIREVNTTSIELDRNRPDDEEEIAAVYKELGKLDKLQK